MQPEFITYQKFNDPALADYFIVDNLVANSAK